MGKNKKLNLKKKIAISLITFVIIAFAFVFISNNTTIGKNFVSSGSQSFSIADENQYKVDYKGKLIVPNKSTYNATSKDLNNQNSNQAFVFTNDLSSSYKTVDYKNTYGPFHKGMSSSSQLVGANCNIGDYVRVLQCTGTSSLNTPTDCSKDLFDNMWYISKTNDYLNFDNFYTKNLDFDYVYNCYQFDGKANTLQEPSCVSGNSCVTKDVAGTNARCFQYQQQCLDYINTVSNYKTNKYGYFKNVNVPSTAKEYSTIDITGTFVPIADFNNLLLESAIDQASYQQTFSIVQSSSSACDSSKYFAGKFVNAKKGVEIPFKFTVQTGGRQGNFNVNIYSAKGCYNDVGYDNEIPKGESTKTISITKRDTTSGSDWDSDGVQNDIDNCPYTKNPKINGVQLDTDGDSVGDACDYCPLDYGIAQYGQDGGKYLGCNPCEGLANNDSCWSNPKFDKYTDPRYNENGSVSGEGKNYQVAFNDYLAQLQKQAEDSMKQDCVLNGGNYSNGICNVVTPSDKCNTNGGIWTGTSCEDKTNLDQSTCKSTNGDWVNNECSYSRNTCETSNGKWSSINSKCDYGTTPYCGDGVCLGNEDKTTCAIDCNDVLKCNEGDIRKTTCPNGDEIVGETCINNIFTKTGNTCVNGQAVVNPIQIDGVGFFDKYKTSIYALGGIATIVGLLLFI